MFYDQDDAKDNYLDREKEAIEQRDNWSWYYHDKDDLDYMQHVWEQD